MLKKLIGLLFSAALLQLAVPVAAQVQAPIVVTSIAGIAAVTFTRPANTTAYASGQLVANSVTAGTVTPLAFPAARVVAGTGMVRRCSLRTSNPSLAGGAFRLHLYNAVPVVANGDGAAWSTAQSANYLGSCDITLDKVFTDGAYGNGTPSVGTEINFVAAAGTRFLYGLLEARGAYTPLSAQTFTPMLEVLQN